VSESVHPLLVLNSRRSPRNVRFPASKLAAVLLQAGHNRSFMNKRANGGFGAGYGHSAVGMAHRASDFKSSWLNPAGLGQPVERCCKRRPGRMPQPNKPYLS